MKYLRPFFESLSSIEELRKDRDDIIRVLTRYCELYLDSNTEKMWEFAWDIGNDFLDEDVIESADKMSNEIVTAIVDSTIQYNKERSARNLLELYYDCDFALGGDSDDITSNIQDIFSDYLDDKKTATFYKTNDKYDNRYVVEISKDNIMTSIDFNEIMGRIDDFVNMDGVEYSGNRDFIKFEFYKSYPSED